MMPITLAKLTEKLELSEQLRAGRSTMIEPQDLPGRFGRIVHDLDRVLTVINGRSVMAGGWAVWRHGYVARVTEDIDIVLAADQIEEFLRVAAVAGFDVLHPPEGRWPKVQHKDTNITVDILPQGARPGVASRPAPTLIRHPVEMGGTEPRVQYVGLPALIELKLAAGRARDINDIVELIRANGDRIAAIRQHLEGIHPQYVEQFNRLVIEAAQDDER